MLLWPPSLFFTKPNRLIMRVGLIPPRLINSFHDSTLSSSVGKPRKRCVIQQLWVLLLRLRALTLTRPVRDNQRRPRVASREALEGGQISLRLTRRRSALSGATREPMGKFTKTAPSGTPVESPRMRSTDGGRNPMKSNKRSCLKKKLGPVHGSSGRADWSPARPGCV